MAPIKRSEIDLAHLPPTVQDAMAAAILGISERSLAEKARRGEAPVTPLRIGRRRVWPTAALLRLVGVE